MNWREYKRGGKQVYNRRPAFYILYLEYDVVGDVVLESALVLKTFKSFNGFNPEFKVASSRI